MKQILTAATVAFGLVAGAAAANAANTNATQNTNSEQSSNQGADQMQHSNLRQQLHEQLSKAGYTDIKVMPSSFYVQAKDKKGDPVAMVIGPDTFTEVTALPQKSAENSSKSGQNSSGQSSSNNAKQ